VLIASGFGDIALFSSAKRPCETVNKLNASMAWYSPVRTSRKRRALLYKRGVGAIALKWNVPFGH